MTRIPDFHEEMERFQNHIPTWVGHNLNRLRGDRAKWLRVPTGVALIGGGVLGFLPLPVVAVWMLPVGLALLAHDIPTMSPILGDGHARRRSLSAIDPITTTLLRRRE